MTIREMTTSEDLREEVRLLMLQFWAAYDKLWVDMDNLTQEEFHIRESEMWGFRNRVSDYDGDYFLISLWGMHNKAEVLYGKNDSQDI